MKKEKRLSALCLAAIAAGSVILGVSDILEIELPDIVRGMIGIVDLLAAPVLVYAVFKIVANKPNE